MDPTTLMLMVEQGHQIFHKAVERNDESTILVALNQTEAAVIAVGLVLAGAAYSNCPMREAAYDLAVKLGEIVKAQQTGTPGWDDRGEVIEI
jgi:hypothetical protein